MKPGVHAGLSSRRSRVQIPSSPPLPDHKIGEVRGQIAQSVERRSEKAEVDGSTPSLTTRYEEETPVTTGVSSFLIVLSGLSNNLRIAGEESVVAGQKVN